MTHTISAGSSGPEGETGVTLHPGAADEAAATAPVETFRTAPGEGENEDADVAVAVAESESEAGADAGPETDSGARRRCLLVLAAVAVAYVIAQLVVMAPRTYLGPDESLYYSQAALNAPAAPMGAPRAWGVPLLAAPLTVITDSIIALRLYLSVLAGFGLYLAFRTWITVRPSMTVPLAAFLFASLWMSLYYGPELMPNLPGALCAVAAVGLFVQALRRPGALGPLVGLVTSLGFMSLLRPTETLPLLAVLGIAGAAITAMPTRHAWQEWPARQAWRPWRAWRPCAGHAALTAPGGRPRTAAVFAAVAAAGCGGAIGWSAWAVEAQVRFGGLFARLALNNRINDVGWHDNVLRHLQAFASGLALCNDGRADCGRITVFAVVIWCSIPPLVAAGLWAVRRTPHLPAVGLAVLAALASAAPYLFYTSLANPRFLLPSYGLLALAVAEGMGWIARRHRVAQAGAALALASVTLNQFAVADAQGEKAEHGRAQHVRVAHRLNALGIRHPCLVYGTGSWQVAVAAGCRSLGDRILRKVSPRPTELRRILLGEAAKGVQVVVVSASPNSGVTTIGWRRDTLLDRPARYVYRPLPAQLPPEAGLPDAEPRHRHRHRLRQRSGDSPGYSGYSGNSG